MTTIRVEHSKNYTCISNAAIRDKKLSFKARGLHHLLLSYPDGWLVKIEHLVNESEPDGRTAIASALNELELSGYLTRQRVRDSETNKFVGWESVIRELPLNNDEPESGFLKNGKREKQENPQSGFPQIGKPNIRETEDIINIYREEVTKEKEVSIPPNPQNEFKKGEERVEEEERTEQELWSNPEEETTPRELDLLANQTGTTHLTSQPTLEDNYGAAQVEVNPTLNMNMHPAEKMEARFRNELPEWRNSRKRNDYAIALIDYLQAEYLPKKSTLHKDQEVMRGEACSWISKREMTEAGLAEIEARLMDAKEWAKKRSQREAIAQRMRGEAVTVEAIAAPVQEPPQNLDEVLLNSVLDRLVENPNYVPSQGILKRLKKPIEWLRADAEKLKAQRA